MKSDIRMIYWAGSVGTDPEFMETMAEMLGTVVIECYRTPAGGEYLARFRQDLDVANRLVDRGAVPWIQYRYFDPTEYNHNGLYFWLEEIIQAFPVAHAFIDFEPPIPWPERGEYKYSERLASMVTCSQVLVNAGIEHELWYNASGHLLASPIDFPHEFWNDSLYRPDDKFRDRTVADQLVGRAEDWYRAGEAAGLYPHVSPGVIWAESAVQGVETKRQTISNHGNMVMAACAQWPGSPAGVAFWPAFYRRPGDNNYWGDLTWQQVVERHLTPWLEGFGSSDGSWLDPVQDVAPE